MECVNILCLPYSAKSIKELIPLFFGIFSRNIWQKIAAKDNLTFIAESLYGINLTFYYIRRTITFEGIDFKTWRKISRRKLCETFKLIAFCCEQSGKA